MSLSPDLPKLGQPQAVKPVHETTAPPLETKIKVTALLGEILLSNGRNIVVGLAPDGSLATADSLKDFDLDHAEARAILGDMGLGKEIDLSARYDLVVPVYIDKTQATIFSVTELKRSESYIRIVATIPKGSIASQHLSALAGTTIELTIGLPHFLEHFRSTQPFFSLRSSRHTAVHTFLVLDVPEGQLDLPREQKSGIALCFQWEKNLLQQAVGDPGISSVSILAGFIEKLIERIDFDSHDRYKPLIDAINLLFAITAQEVGTVRKMQMRFSWKVSELELQTLQAIRARVHDTRHPHPFLLPQLIITAIAHYESLKGETHAEMIKNLVDWLATDPTGLLTKPEPKARHSKQVKERASEPEYNLAITPYHSDNKQFPQCANVDTQWLRVRSSGNAWRQASEYQELHDAQDVAGWCEQLCSLLKPEAHVDLHLRFHILQKLYRYVRNGELLGSNVRLTVKENKEIEMTVAHHLYARATQILHSMSSLDFETLQGGGFLDVTFRESGALYFMCYMHKYAPAELCAKFMERWVTAHLARLQNFVPPFNSSMIAAFKELMIQAENFLDKADSSTTAASIRECRMLLNWTRSLINTRDTTEFPKFITPTAHGRVEPIDMAAFSVEKWTPSPDKSLDVPVFFPSAQHIAQWANGIASEYLAGNGSISSGDLLQKLQDAFKHVVDDKSLRALQVAGANLSLPEFLKNKIDELRCSHITPLGNTTLTVEQWCAQLLQAVRQEQGQFSLIPDKCLQLFTQETTKLFNLYQDNQPPRVSQTEAASLVALLSYIDKVISYYNEATGKLLRPGAEARHYIDQLRRISQNSNKIRSAISLGSMLQTPKRK